MSVKIAADAIIAPIHAELDAVEACMSREILSEIRVVEAVSGHTLFAGGKRLRPAAALLCGNALDRRKLDERAIEAAAAVELIHMASLMHDDVVDDAGARRGRPTAGAVYGTGLTILAGDYLLAKSIHILARNDQNLNLIRLFAGVTVGMTEGEVLQASVSGDITIPVSTYEDVIERKTARFIAGCCEAGGRIGGATEAEAASFRMYGHHIGMAFQIADDLLDLTGDPEQTGKPIGTDLRDGRVTLPLIYALETMDDVSRDAFVQALGRDTLTDADIADVVDILKAQGAIARTWNAARGHAACAQDAIGFLPEGPCKAALLMLAEYSITRHE